MPLVMLAVLARSLLAALLVAALMAHGGWAGVGAGALLGLALAVMPIVILSGAVVHENTPIALAAVHSLDWVAKLVVIGAIVGLLAR